MGSAVLQHECLERLTKRLDTRAALEFSKELLLGTKITQQFSTLLTCGHMQRFSCSQWTSVQGGPSKDQARRFPSDSKYTGPADCRQLNPDCRLNFFHFIQRESANRPVAFVQPLSLSPQKNRSSTRKNGPGEE